MGTGCSPTHSPTGVDWEQGLFSAPTPGTAGFGKSSVGLPCHLTIKETWEGYMDTPTCRQIQ